MSILKNTKIALPVSIDYILWSEMSAFSTIGNKVQITLAAGAAWKNIYVTPGSILFEQSTPASIDDFLYNPSLTAEIPSINEEMVSKLDDIFRDQLIIRVKFTDGSFRIMASPVLGIAPIIKIEEVKSATRDSAKLTCSLTLPNPCPFYISS